MNVVRHEEPFFIHSDFEQPLKNVLMLEDCENMCPF